MKKMKKLASLLLALVMTLAMAMPVFAAQPTEPTEPTESIVKAEQGTSQTVNGKITISNAIVGQTYDLYRIFELQSYNNESEAYTYKVMPEWKDFCKNGDGAAYVDVDDQDYVTWKKGVDDAKAAEFAVKALAYAKKHTDTIKTTDSGKEEPTYDADTETGKKNGETTEITFSPLKLGYYLVDSTVGTLCSLTTTNNIQTIIDKNEKPTVEKEVEEDDEKDDTKKYGDDNDAMIGQLVNYRTTITAQKGAINYTLHDKMTGLDFEEVKTVVLQKADGTKTPLTNNDYTVKTSGVCDKKCSFEVEFNNTFAAGLENGDKIVVEYSAKVNASAVIAGTGNPNTTSLTYGDDVTNLNETDEDETRTYTFKFDLVKTNSEDELLSGATFQLFENQTGGTALQFVKEDGSYRVATDSDTNTTADIVVEGGKTTIIGLDGNSSYYLEETVAPNGYNKLAGRVEVQLSEKVKGTDGNVNVNIGSGDQAGSVNATIELENNKNKYVSGGVEVENNAGTLLPSTGGIGTTIFYVVGTILVLGAGILLVTKRRMKAQ